MLLLFLAFFTALREAASNPPSSPLCNTTLCGDVNISYPFWLKTGDEPPTASLCGYPELAVRCSQSTALLSLTGNQNYRIRKIDYNASTVTVTHTDVVDAGCPRVRRNVTLNSVPLTFSPRDVNLSFYYNCTNTAPSILLPLGCSGGLESWVSIATAAFNWFGVCEEMVVVPVEKPGDYMADLAKDLQKLFEAVTNGFSLIWKAAGTCGSCENSGKRCGFVNGASQETRCFCRDDDESCRKGRKRDWALKTIIGIVAAVVGMGLACLAVFIYQRRRKNRFVLRSSLLPRSLSSSGPSPKTVGSEKGGIHAGVHIFTYDELEEATNNFDSTKELGDGGFGTVYHGKLRDGRCVAVKRLYENNYRRLEQFMNEVEILTRLRHKNLVSLYGSTSGQSRELLLVYEFVANGTVASHLHGDRATAGALSWTVRMSIATETASALTYLHFSEIVHRDVKTDNILLDENFCVKVADFGLSRLFPTQVTHVSTAPQGTPGYVDPEYHQCYQLTSKSDVYSFGVVLVELLSSKPAVDITRHRQEINLANMAMTKIQNNSLHELVDPSLGFETDGKVRRMVEAVAELAFQCLQSEKEMRPSMEEVLETLRRTQKEGFGVEDGESPADDTAPLRRKPPPIPPSPDSVTATWVSTSTTPNASG